MSRVILCHAEDFPYVEDYINNFKNGGLVIQYTNSTPPFVENQYYLCVRRIPFGLLPKECKIGFVNTEQLSDPKKYEEYKTFARDNIEIFDFSYENIKISKKGEHLPYIEDPAETEKLKEFIKAPKKFNIAIIGTPTTHRIDFITTLRKAGFTINFICEFGDTRDKQVGECSVLLNLHALKDYSIYETVRCERWRFAGMHIISEECLDKVPSGIITSSREDMIQTLRDAVGNPTPPTFRIGLCMIVKDESHIIHEVLKSTLGLIDTYVIVDTGSSDNTIQIINDFYSKTDIKGHVFERSWKGFGKSRTEALSLCDDHMDYILMIDADDLMDYPESSKIFLKRVFEEKFPNACNVHLKRGNIEYERVQIFKARDGWRYVGVLHEYPTNDKKNNIIIRLPNNIYMTGRTMGNRSLQEGNKYQRDAETLLKALEEEPENERYMFYLAQSYRDAGMHEAAIKWYKKRFEVGKWVEEQFVSALNLARLTNDKDWAWKGHEIFPMRSESLVAYMSHCRSNGKWSRELLAMALYASTITKPKETVLFLEIDVYDWRVWDELAIIAFFTGQKAITKMACEKLLAEKKFPESQRDRIETNLKMSSL
jgi:glycosyltransferase involved in cell wall biosynthesis